MNNVPQFVPSYSADAVGLNAIPVLSVRDFREAVIRRVAAGDRISALFGKPDADGGDLRLMVVLADDSTSTLQMTSTCVKNNYRALTPDCLQAHGFEREIHELWGVLPTGHPWLKPLRFQPRPAGDPAQPGVMKYFAMEGAEIHEVAVGPVHAGIIEPGHFRFQCHGEHVYHLEISLGYQHRGVERALVGGPDKRTIHYMETLAGDTTIGHATAYAQAVEALSETRVPARAHALRGVALELERLANHTGDLGALANDIGFLPTASYCGRLRGDFLNMTALLCGSRFGRGFVRPGGVSFDMEPDRAESLLRFLKSTERDVKNAVELLWGAPTVMARFEEVGVVQAAVCRELGLVGPAARACGIPRDIRHDFPTGIYRFSHIPVSTSSTGDVFGRAYVRWLEIQRSLEFLQNQLTAIPDGSIRADIRALPPDRAVASLVEGWRGEICHVATTDASGRFAGYKIVDPSFHNWMGLAMAMRDQQISDFPLCNKSFNLSYCGHDL